MRISVWSQMFLSFAIVILVMAYIFHQNLLQDGQLLLEAVRIHRDNFLYPFHPQRRRPISTLDKEILLVSLMKEPFEGFERPDWERFWKILYGVFPVEGPQDEHLPPRVRQLSNDEMESRLKKTYPFYFSYLKQEDWRKLWEIIFGKRYSLDEEQDSEGSEDIRTYRLSD